MSLLICRYMAFNLKQAKESEADCKNQLIYPIISRSLVPKYLATSSLSIPVRGPYSINKSITNSCPNVAVSTNI